MFDSDEISPAFGKQLSEKMARYYLVMHRSSERALMALNSEELKVVRSLYGENLTYPIYLDIDQLLCHPDDTEQVH